MIEEPETKETTKNVERREGRREGRRIGEEGEEGLYPTYLLTVSTREGRGAAAGLHNHLRPVWFELSPAESKKDRARQREIAAIIGVFVEHWIGPLYSLAYIRVPREESKILSWNASSAIWPPPIATRLAGEPLPRSRNLSDSLSRSFSLYYRFAIQPRIYLDRRYMAAVRSLDHDKTS